MLLDESGDSVMNLVHVDRKIVVVDSMVRWELRMFRRNRRVVLAVDTRGVVNLVVERCAHCRDSRFVVLGAASVSLDMGCEHVRVCRVRKIHGRRTMGVSELGRHGPLSSFGRVVHEEDVRPGGNSLFPATVARKRHMLDVGDRRCVCAMDVIDIHRVAGGRAYFLPAHRQGGVDRQRGPCARNHGSGHVSRPEYTKVGEAEGGGLSNSPAFRCCGRNARDRVEYKACTCPRFRCASNQSVAL